jgi:hypothetical protein
MPRNFPEKPGIPFLSGVPTRSRIDLKEKVKLHLETVRQNTPDNPPLSPTFYCKTEISRKRSSWQAF